MAGRRGSVASFGVLIQHMAKTPSHFPHFNLTQATLTLSELPL
jgi:hypothetical protein